MGISSVTSEALQLKLRQLLPSQQGFGTDLSAQDTIVPIIDLTRAAEGSDIGVNLQEAFSFGSNTAFNVFGTTVAIANTVGFFKLQGNVVVQNTSSSCVIEFNDGTTSTNLLNYSLPLSAATKTAEFEFYVFLKAGVTLNAIASGTGASIKGSIRQIADGNGTLVQPSGFTPQ
tara:strand:+ start:372 stop:890 length:519 start_codon:yes stop_codon:yes gene_type:complete